MYKTKILGKICVGSGRRRKLKRDSCRNGWAQSIDFIKEFAKMQNLTLDLLSQNLQFNWIPGWYFCIKFEKLSPKQKIGQECPTLKRKAPEENTRGSFHSSVVQRLREGMISV